MSRKIDSERIQRAVAASLAGALHKAQPGSLTYPYQPLHRLN
jgi:hypothetical protein